MKDSATGLAIIAALLAAPILPSHAQEAAAEECVVSSPPPRLLITLPVEPAKPACATKGVCSKAVADKFNAEVVVFNSAMMKANEAAGQYVDKLNAYMRDANRYANCEIQRLNSVMVK
jgi:hypothetical protein